MVVPQNLKPRSFISLLIASDSLVVTGSHNDLLSSGLIYDGYSAYCHSGGFNRRNKRVFMRELKRLLPAECISPGDGRFYQNGVQGQQPIPIVLGSGIAR